MSAQTLPCPVCSRPGQPVAPMVRRGHRSGKFMLEGCDHAWALIDYRSFTDTEAEARQRWNDWVRTRPPEAVAAAS